MDVASVTLDEVLRAARARSAALVPETSGYLALAIGDASSRLPYRIEDDLVTLTTEGTIRVARGRESISPEESARVLRDHLHRLLSVSAGSMPGLAQAGSARSEPGGPDLVIAEIEAALIPVNRAAARRSLARLARDTARARDAGRLAAHAPPIAGRAAAQAARATAASAAQRPAAQQTVAQHQHAVAQHQHAVAQHHQAMAQQTPHMYGVPQAQAYAEAYAPPPQPTYAPAPQHYAPAPQHYASAPKQHASAQEHYAPAPQHHPQPPAQPYATAPEQPTYAMAPQQSHDAPTPQPRYAANPQGDDVAAAGAYITTYEVSLQTPTRHAPAVTYAEQARSAAPYPPSPSYAEIDLAQAMFEVDVELDEPSGHEAMQVAEDMTQRLDVAALSASRSESDAAPFEAHDATTIDSVEVIEATFERIEAAMLRHQAATPRLGTARQSTLEGSPTRHVVAAIVSSALEGALGTHMAAAMASPAPAAVALEASSLRLDAATRALETALQEGRLATPRPRKAEPPARLRRLPWQADLGRSRQSDVSDLLARFGASDPQRDATTMRRDIKRTIGIDATQLPPRVATRER